MKKTGLRILGMLAVVMTAFVLVACGGGADPAEGVTFQNDLGVKVQGFYISSTSESAWGDPVETSIGDGKSVVISADVLVDGEGVAYDVAALDDNDMVYEFYEVTIGKGTTLAISQGDPDPVLVVTGADGSTTSITGYSYHFEG